MTVDLDDPVAVALAVTGALRAESIDHALYGGLALASYGRPRETKDADIAVAGVRTDSVYAALRRAGLDATLTFERIRFGGLWVTRFTLLGGDGDLNMADIIEARSASFSARMLQRALGGTLRGQPVTLISPEDFVVFKILSTRERDIEDARAVRAALAGTLDGALIAREVKALGSELADHDIAARFARYLTD